MLTATQTGGVMVAANKNAAVSTAKLIAGKIINQRVVKLIRPQLPMMARGYADSALGEAVIANAVAAAIVHIAPNNEKAVLASQAMIDAAMLEFMSSFNLDEKIDDLLKGIDIKALKGETEGA